MASDNPKNGFSLIEILVVSTVILTTTGLAVASYSSFNDTQKLKQAARTLKNDLRFIQTRAISGVKPTGCNTLVSYRMTFAASGASYTYRPICTNAVTGATRTVTLPVGVLFSPVPSGNVNFSVLTGTVNPITLTLHSQNTTNTIALSENGDINDLGLSVGP